jgi:hypothetical protein
MIIYDSADIYINSATTNAARIVALDAVITALLAAATSAAVDEGMTEYILDDGQTKIQCNLRGVEAIMRSISSLEKIKQMYMNQLNGRIVRLVDSKSFSNRNNGR